MNKELKVIYEDNNRICLSWDKLRNETDFVIMGKNSTFDDIRIVKTKKNSIELDKTNLREYLELYVLYVIKNKKTRKEKIIEKTDPVNISTNILKILKVSTTKSYNGVSIVINSNDLYDKFYLYEVNDDKLDLVLESMDFVITTDILSENKTYYIEGYKKVDDELVLSAKSLMFTITDYTVSNNTSVDLSIIIPVYNCENYLPRCLDSILLSTFKNIELILVNDGSKDNSKRVINWYKKKYGNLIKAIDKENGGPASARNVGTKYADGKYLAYIDSDDIVHPNMFSELYKYAIIEDADISVSKVIAKKEDYTWEVWLDVQEKEKGVRYRAFSYDEMMYNKLYNFDDNIYIVTLWNQIMKTSLAKAHPIPDYKYYEDAAYTRAIYSHAKRFVIALDAYYVWDRRISNTTGTISSNYNSKEDPYVLAEFYSSAIFYWLEDYNKEHFDYLIYDSIKEAFIYLKNDLKEGKEQLLSNIYAKKVIFLLRKYDLNKNQYVIHDPELVEGLVEIGKYLK